MTDPNHPLQNRVIQGIYPPGSTFKIVDSIAGLEEGTLKPETEYNCPGGLWFGGREYHCWRHQGHGTIELHDAIVRSCDVYFYNVGEKLGVDRIAKWSNQMGLGIKSGIDLDHENPGTIPSSAWKQKRYHERWYPAETLSVAIGQGYVATTPLQMAQVAAQVANGGIRYKPQFVKYVEGLDGNIAKSYPPIVENRMKIDPDALADVKDAMADVVNGAGGTAHKAHLDNVVVCGKTGTAQVVGDKGGGESEEEEDKNTPDQYQGPRVVHRVRAQGSSDHRRRLHHRARRSRRQRVGARDPRRLPALLPAQSAAAGTENRASARSMTGVRR